MLCDGFIFFNEFEILDIRLHELDPVVDRFVLVESNVTFTGKPKPLYFQENRSRFECFLPKIIHVVVTDTPETDDPWVREHFHRNAIVRGLDAVGAAPTDYFMLSDVDEIPSAKTLGVMPVIDVPHALTMKSYGCFFNAYTGSWNYACIAPFSCLHKQSLEDLRHTAHPLIPDGGWHFSSCGGVAKIMEKLSAYAHQEPEVQRLNNQAYLEGCFKTGAGMFGGAMNFVSVDGLPEYVIQNQDRLRDLGFLK